MFWLYLIGIGVINYYIKTAFYSNPKVVARLTLVTIINEVLGE